MVSPMLDRVRRTVLGRMPVLAVRPERPVPVSMAV
jgi:hypothetical protein